MISEPKPAPLFGNRRVTFLHTPLGLVELLEETLSASPEEFEQIPRKTLAIAATFTAEPLKDALDFWMGELELPLEVRFAPYNQVFQQLLDPTSMIAENQGGIDVLLVRLQDWGMSGAGAFDSDNVERNVRDFVAALKQAATRGTWLVCICPAPSETEHGRLYRQMEDLLASELEAMGNVYLIGSEEPIKTYPVARFDDPHGEELGHVPYTPAYFTALGTLIARRIHAIGRDPYKVIVLDCDNTLWHGVCAEDGLMGVHMSAPHLALQRFMIAQQQAGKLLCLCSKNREADALAVLDRRADMLLGREHLAAWRIDWRPKSENIKSLAEELNLGLSSFIFVDDSPVECAEVRAHCPEVTTIHLPTDTNRWAGFLDHFWAFDNTGATLEDRQRTRYYQQERQRERLHRAAPTFRDFLAGLELEIAISTMIPAQLGRAAQLTQRTNQFNCTTVRRTETEIRQLCESGPLECLMVTVKDRFGDYGLVGVMLFEPIADAIRVDTFLLSCRAMGRGVEHRMLARLGEIANERGCDAIEIPYVPTEKNQPALDFLESIGGPFKQSAPRGWEFRLPAESVYGLIHSLEETPASPEGSSVRPRETHETKTQPQSAPFQRIATELYDAERILERIRSRTKRAPDASEDYVAPRTPEEELLAGIWADVLNLDRVGIHDNFFRLGGHSLLGTQVMSRIRDVFAAELPLHTLFELPTIAQLAPRLPAAPQKDSRPPIPPVDRAKPLPLSFAQQRLWFLDRLEGKSATYNIVAAARLDGDLDLQALENSLRALVARHESLRTVFLTVDGAPVARIVDEPWELAVSDLRALPEAERESALQRLLKEEALHTFDLATGPLFRARLIRLGETAHILQVNLHHIIADGWSMGVFVREWRVFYEAAVGWAKERSDVPMSMMMGTAPDSSASTTNAPKGAFAHPTSLPPLPIQYVDFANWQRQWLTGDVLDGQLTYWKRQLAGAPALLELPTDHPRPPVQRYRGASLTFSFPDELTARLNQLSQQTDSTLFMTLWSAFAVLLARYSGQDDIVIGSPIANRTHSQTESLIGFFVNTLVLRLDLSGNPSFAALQEQASKTALDAYAHQDVPFEHLVEILQPPRNLSHAPFFQVMFVLQNAPLPDLELPGLKLSLLEQGSVTAKFDLTLEITETDSGLVGRLEYNTDLFDRATMERMTGHLKTLLAGIVENPQMPIHELPLLTEAERRQLLEWNDTAVDYPQDKCIHELFEEQVAKTPNAVAVVFQDKQLTYRELNIQANQLARHLQTLGVGPEVLVGICIERSLEMVIGLLGILKAGGAYVPLDPDYPAERLAFMAEDAGLKVLLCHGATRDRLPECAARILELDEEAAAIAGENPGNLVRSAEPDNLAYVIYTSGSTGKPKGVMIEHSNVINFLCSMRRKPRFSNRDILLSVTTLSFDISGLELFLPIIFGGRLVVTGKTDAKDGGALTLLLDKHRVTFLQATPATWRLLEAEKWRHCSFLKALCGGEALPGDLADSLSRNVSALWNMYGPTETTIWSLIKRIRSEEAVTIGRPIANTRIYILDAGLHPLPIGIPGELHIGGAGLARGYLNRPELTAEKFIPNPFSDDPDSRLYKTGDLCRYLPDGNIEYLGRMDNQVKIRGFRMELGEIEAALTQHPDVQEAVVVAREDKSLEDEPGEKRLVAFVSSDLVPTRIPFESDCRLEYDGQTIPLQTADICTAGALLAGEASIEKGQHLRLQVRLPGESEARWLQGRVAYSRDATTGIDFRLTPEEQMLMDRGVIHELEEKGFIGFLQYSLRDKLRLFLQEKLPDYMIPSEFVLLISLPLTPNGKVDRRALSERPIKALQRPETGFVAPRTAEEETLANIWAEALGIERVGIHDNFFDLGGHSLLAVSLLAKIERQFGKRLPLSALFQGATIAEMVPQLMATPAGADHGDRGASNPWRPLVAIQTGSADATPFFCLPGAGGNVLYLHALARALGEDQPFYGLQAVGLDGETEPDASIEDMAARYIREIRTVQPHGPYLLGGHTPSAAGWSWRWPSNYRNRASG
uniref:HAD-superfamily phosphatase, subfamily IIIC/FkbH-like domain-containing protein/amino acid adenylation domain-containing protein n=1 Tax=Candidatus Kentrum sp. LPFa TaxID=2126335 RepID=A0A450WKJ7_9GAMM|nr:MAG: HAD-superfamily phosphatase, subfamily IIIC/FkbH-like domain-containing protein/amino acid adenylation domain-containing protein [Candidatus Kentron sp. LPFa]